MAQGILQPDGSICRAGSTCRRHGVKTKILPAHAIDTIKSQLDEAKALAKAPQPIIIETSKFLEPAYNDVTYAVDYSFESYYCNGCYGCETGEDYCRGAQYEGLKLDSVNSSAVLARLLSCNNISYLTSDDIDFANNIGLDDLETYEIRTEGGYYGEEVSIHVGDKQMKLIRDWYFSKENANDIHGVLAYCRSKGLPTTGMTPIVAIKEQLRLENNGIIPKDVEQAETVTVESIPISSITKGQMSHFKNVMPRPVESLTSESRKITGVLLRKNKALKLIDGYHRVKFVENIKDSIKGEFLVLS